MGLFAFGSGSRHERVPFVSRFVFRADADGPQTAHGTFVFTDAATDAQRGINTGFLQAHLNGNLVAGERRRSPLPGKLHVLAGIFRDQMAFAGGLFQPDKIIARAQRARWQRRGIERQAVRRDGARAITAVTADGLTLDGAALSSGTLGTGDYFVRLENAAGERRLITENSGQDVKLAGQWTAAPSAGDKIFIEVRLQKPCVDPALCIGCGICEHECPVSGLRAIRVSAENESRNKRHSLMART